MSAWALTPKLSDNSQTMTINDAAGSSIENEPHRLWRCHSDVLQRETV